jgi:hemoglobin
MKKLFFALLLSASSLSFAQSAPLEGFGGKAGLNAMTQDFVGRLYADPRIASFFKDSNKERLVEQLAAQFCNVLGGDCKYEGGDMKNVHASMDITRAHFNALVEQLQFAMAAKNVPFSAQNTLLSKLAHMHRDIVNK